jgi:hypothetical protein
LFKRGELSNDAPEGDRVANTIGGLNDDNMERIFQAQAARSDFLDNPCGRHVTLFVIVE